MEWTPESLINTARSFWISSAVQAAVQLDMFSPLAEKPLSEAALAQRIGCSPKGTGMLATVLVALDLLRREGDLLALTIFSRRYLDRNSGEYLGHIIRHFRHLVHAWSRLDEAVSTGHGLREQPKSARTGDELESFLLGMVNMSRVQAGKTVAGIDLGGCRALLDLGGGTGSYAVQFCLANPQLGATVFDLPGSRALAERYIASQGLADRITFLPGDFTQDPLPSGFDVAWLSHILHGVGPETAQGIVNKAARSLQSGGRILIQEFVVDDSRDGPLYSALFGLNMLVNTPDGQAYTEGELRRMLLYAGAHGVERLPLELPGGLGIIVGTMP